MLLPTLPLEQRIETVIRKYIGGATSSAYDGETPADQAAAKIAAYLLRKLRPWLSLPAPAAGGALPEEYPSGSTHPEFDAWWEQFGKPLMGASLSLRDIAFAAWAVAWERSQHQRHAPLDGRSDPHAMREMHGVFDGPEYREAGNDENHENTDHPAR